MTILYNCHHSGDQYRITKFDSDMNPMSSYLCSLEECDCPRGPHPTCRHRQMLPKFISRQHVGDEWFLDFDRGGWVQMGEEWNGVEPIIGPVTFEPMPPLPGGVTIIVMDHPDKVVDVHNAIADAVGEPEATFTYTTDEPPLEIIHVELFVDAPQPAPKHIKRRL